MAVKGKKKAELTKEGILERCSPYDIYRRFFGDFTINEVTCNHLRGENNPSLIIGNKYGELRHKDMGSNYWKGTCFDLVMQIYSCDFPTALRIIDKELNLGIQQAKIDNFNPITWSEPKEAVIKPPPIIQFTTRKPTKEELQYWEGYGLTLEDLKKENIYFPKTIYRNKERLPNKIMTFCYYYPDIQKVKIYRPLAPKREKNTPSYLYKWDNSGIPFDYVDNLKSIKNCKYAFLGKSKKCRMVLQKVLGISCIADVQAEDPSCISESTLQHFKSNSEHQVTLFDSDQKGKESSMWLTEHYGFKHCNVPDKYLKEGIKDFSDLFRKYGENPIIEHFRQKKFI
jgi:hypothetical protein